MDSAFAEWFWNVRSLRRCVREQSLWDQIRHNRSKSVELFAAMKCNSLDAGSAIEQRCSAWLRLQ
jgi:hypothetical protein